ncbi:MAG: excinuclease ABC subunit UvrA, partial [Planctomycetota bacterium]
RDGIEGTVIVDRVSEDTDLARLTDSVENAMGEGHGTATFFCDSKEFGGRRLTIDGHEWFERRISDQRRCDDCDRDFPNPVPRLFNFNNPLGACEKCEGFGELIDFDMDLVVPDKSRSLSDGAIAPWNTPSYAHELEELLALADDYGIPIDVPYSELKTKHLRLINDGIPERHFGGLKGFFAWLDRKKYKMHVRIFASRYRTYRTCDACDGQRYNEAALSYRIGGKSSADLLSMNASELDEFLQSDPLDQRERKIAAEPIRQITDRVSFLRRVGLDYLELDRPLRTLSGGETQRVALTSALGGSLVNMLYVLDEPTAGLHPRDVEPLIDCVKQLRDRGNTVIVVEHNRLMIEAADQVVEVGPGAGEVGGEIVFQGTPKQLARDKSSLTGAYLAGRRGATFRADSERQSTGTLRLEGARGNNLKQLDVAFPLGVLCVVTGVSGSGKSTLVQDTLFPAVQTRRLGQSAKSLPYENLVGAGGFKDCILVDQSPISRSPRSCPVTYMKAFDPIRKVFAESTDAKANGLTASHFTFNSEKGQCPECEGAGVLEVDMQFLADVSMRCPECRGTRYRDEVLKVRYRDRTIADVLAMSVNEAYAFFRGAAKVQARLKRMMDVGLGYISLGQPATTLSSGEGQRLKLAAFLASATRQRTLFIMDEPTTGLHFDDLVRLLDCFDALLADGHSLIVVEHHPLVMLAADHLIDLGPGSGADGGYVVAEGSPDEIMESTRSITGRILRSSMETLAASG